MNQTIQPEFLHQDDTPPTRFGKFQKNPIASKSNSEIMIYLDLLKVVGKIKIFPEMVVKHGDLPQLQYMQIIK